MTESFFVYVYKNPLKENEIFYVGYGNHNRSDKKCRALDHLHEVQKGIISKNRHKYYTIKQIIDNNLLPIIEIVLDNVSKKEAIEKEKDLILKHSQTLVNIAKGGDGGDTISQQTPERKKEISEKMRATRKKNNKKMSLEFRRKTSERMSGINNTFYGKTHTPENRYLSGCSMRGKKMSGETLRKKHVLRIYTVMTDKSEQFQFIGVSSYNQFFQLKNSKLPKSQKISFQKMIKEGVDKGWRIVASDCKVRGEALFHLLQILPTKVFEGSFAMFSKICVENGILLESHPAIKAEVSL